MSDATQVVAQESELYDALRELYEFTAYAASDPRLWWFMREERWQEISDRCVPLLEGPEPTYWTACERCGEFNIEIIDDMAPEMCDDCEEGQA